MTKEVSKKARKKRVTLSQETKLEIVRDHLLNGIDQCQVAKKYFLAVTETSQL